MNEDTPAVQPKPIAALSAAFPNVFHLPDYFLRLEVTPPAGIVFRILRPDQFLKYLGGERVQLQPLIGIPVAEGSMWSIDRQPWVPGPQVLVVDPAVDGDPTVPGVVVAVVGRADLPHGGNPQVSDMLEVDYNGWRPAMVTRACTCSDPCPHRRNDLMGRPVNCACPPEMRRQEDPCPHDSRQILQPGHFQVDGVIQDGPLMGRGFGMNCAPGEEGVKWRWAARRA